MTSQLINPVLSRRRMQTILYPQILQSVITLLMLCGGTNAFCTASALAADKPAERRTLLTGQVNQLLVLCTAAGLTLDKPSVPAEITKLRLGSTAAYSGVRCGDRILNAKVDQNILQLTLQRGDKKFLASMAVDSKALKSMVPKSEAVPLAAKTIPATLTSKHLASNITDAQAEQILTEYNFIVLIDRSGSMAEAENGSPLICPPDPADTNPQSTKLAWVKDNIRTFADFLRSRTKGPVTLIPFNASYTVEVVNSPADIPRAVDNLRPEGGTNLTAALSHGVALALAENRKQMVVVMTDGMNNIGNMERTMIEATKVVPPGQVVVSFIQIGSDKSGIDAVAKLDTGLISKGATYDMVDAKYFSDVKQYGLKRVLADAVLRATAPRK